MTTWRDLPSAPPYGSWDPPAPSARPVTPPGWHVPTPPPADDRAAPVAPVGRPPERRSGLARLAAVVGASLVVAASVLGGWVAGSIAGEDQATDALATAATDPRPLEVPAVEVPGVEPPASLAPPVMAGGADAAADAAEIVGPSVVQLNLMAGLGSGVYYDDVEGLILTAAHVVGSSREVDVTFSDGSTVPGRVVGTHRPTDVAVVQIEPLPGVPAAELAIETELRVGQLAVAVGSPFGFDRTVTSGIVSAVDRDVQNIPMVQTDAAINPGNSGGPLVDAAGRVIGINDQIFTASGDNAGVGFAISIDLAKIVADQLVDGVEVELARLGVSTSPSPEGGAVIEEVFPDTAAAEAGLEPGDRIVAVDGAGVVGSADLRSQIITSRPGSDTEISIERDDRRIDVDVTLRSTGTDAGTG